MDLVKFSFDDLNGFPSASYLYGLMDVQPDPLVFFDVDPVNPNGIDIRVVLEFLQKKKITDKYRVCCSLPRRGCKH